MWCASNAPITPHCSQHSAFLNSPLLSKRVVSLRVSWFKACRLTDIASIAATMSLVVIPTGTLPVNSISRTPNDSESKIIHQPYFVGLFLTIQNLDIPLVLSAELPPPTSCAG